MLLRIRLLPIIFTTPVCVLRLTGRCRSFILTRPLHFNTEKGREEVGIVLPLREAQPLIGLACLDTDAAAGAFCDPQALFRAEAVLRKLYRLFLTLSQRISKAQ